jgi:hypothetical protein
MAKVIQGYSFPDDVTEDEAKAFIQKQKAASAPREQPQSREPIPAAEAPQEMGWGEYGEGLVKSAVSGLTFNWSDEALARARSALPGGVPYEQALQEEREQLKKFQGQYPVAAIGSEIAGSIPTAFVPGLGGAKFIQGTARIAEAAKPLIQAGITGFKQGVVGGAGGSEGDITTAEGLKTMAQDSATGGALGTAIGTGMTALGRAASPVIGRVQEWMNPKKYSEDVAKMKVLEDLKRSNLTPEQAQAKYEYMESTGATPSYFDVAPSLTSRAETIAQRPGASGEALTEDVIARQQGQRKRIMEQAKERLDVDKPYFDDVDDAVKALRTNAAPIYKEAYKAKIPAEAQYELQVIMDDVNAAFPKASKYAERLFLAERNKGFRETGTPALISKDFEGLPKLQQYDYIMRGLSQVKEAETDVAGKVSQLGVGAQDLRASLAKVLDESVPEFAAARAQYKGDLEVKNALLNARKEFLRADPEELARDWAKMSVAEKEAYRAGALKSIRDSLFGSADYTDATKRIGQAVQDRREALNIIMPEKMSAKLFENYLEAEARIASNAQRIKSGSPTARRLEGAKDLEAQPDMTAFGVAGDVAKGKFGAAANRLFNTLVKNPAIPEARANAIGNILRSGTPEEVDRATKSLVAFVEEQQRKEAARLVKEKLTAVPGRIIGGRIASNRPPPPPEDDSYELPPLTIRRGP